MLTRRQALKTMALGLGAAAGLSAVAAQASTVYAEFPLTLRHNEHVAEFSVHEMIHIRRDALDAREILNDFHEFADKRLLVAQNADRILLLVANADLKRRLCPIIQGYMTQHSMAWIGKTLCQIANYDHHNHLAVILKIVSREGDLAIQFNNATAGFIAHFKQQQLVREHCLVESQWLVLHSERKQLPERPSQKQTRRSGLPQQR